jgi:hypothetical protein
MNAFDYAFDVFELFLSEANSASASPAETISLGLSVFLNEYL